jgi:methylated-DNA-[protein]-cysteine S-methyltransferase
MRKNKTLQASATSAMETPIGTLRLLAEEDGLTHVFFPNEDTVKVEAADPASPAALKARPHIEAAEKALQEFFAGTRKEFSGLTLAPRGTPFQQSVWRALLTIPYGVTWSYKDIAEKIGNPKAVRAVGLANGQNPIPVIIPCHRVIGSNGALTGFGGGLPTKEWLLIHEGALTSSLL